jgi:choline-sulfatase
MKIPVFTLIVIAIITYACGSSSVQSEEKESKHFRNVIFIIGDDHSTEVLGAYGNKIVRTPNLDQMAKRGIMFTHAYVNSPVCSPSRQSMITGKYPHATGVSLLKSSFPEEQVTIADHLSPLGFKTALIGKHHFNNTSNHGFNLKIDKKDYLKHVRENSLAMLSADIKSRPTWKPFKDPAHIWLNAEGLPSAYRDEDEAGTFYAKKAIDFINQNREERFCLWLGFEEPHSPFNFPVEFADRYNPDEMPLPQGSPEDDRWVPAVFKDLTDEQKKGIIASYYTSVEFLDKNVGLVLDAVNQDGLAESTLVIYVGDHGYLLNDHKRFEKHMMWEPAVKAPLIIQAGEKYGQSRVEPAMTEFIDLVPTAIEALGVDALSGVHGKSLVPLLAKETDKHKDHVFSEFLEDNKAMIRTREWKYIFTTGKSDLGQGYATGNPPPGITHRLYDMAADPKETHNLSNDSRHQEIISQLQQKMLRVFETTHPAGKLPDNWSIEKKFAAYCEPPEGGASK